MFFDKSKKSQKSNETHIKLSIWIPTSHTSLIVLSSLSQHLPITNSQIPDLGAKSSKSVKFYPLVKIAILVQN